MCVIVSHCVKKYKKNYQKVDQKEKSCQEIVKKERKVVRKSCQKVVKKLQKNVKKLSKKLSKSCQKVVKKVVKKL
jgi:alanyl-tRNA synthetase